MSVDTVPIQMNVPGPPGPVALACRWSPTVALPAYTISGGGSTLTLNAPGALTAQDGVTPALGDVFFLPPSLAQAGADSGPWQITTLGATGVAMVAMRPSNFGVGKHARGFPLEVTQGTANGGHIWFCNSDDGADVVGSSSLSWVDVVAAGIGTTVLLKANNLSDLVSASAARTNLGLGSAATQASSAFDAAGAAAAVDPSQLASPVIGTGAGQDSYNGGTLVPSTLKSASFTALTTVSRYRIDTAGVVVTLASTDPEGTTYEVWNITRSATPNVTFTPNGGLLINISGTYNQASIGINADFVVRTVTKIAGAWWISS